MFDFIESVIYFICIDMMGVITLQIFYQVLSMRFIKKEFILVAIIMALTLSILHTKLLLMF